MADLSSELAAERIAELGEILAAGLQRLSARKASSKPADFGERALDLGGPQSGHPDDLSSENGNG